MCVCLTNCELIVLGSRRAIGDFNDDIVLIDADTQRSLLWTLRGAPQRDLPYCSRGHVLAGTMRTHNADPIAGLQYSNPGEKIKSECNFALP